MRLTKRDLQEYIETEELIRRLERRKDEIREAIKARGDKEFEMGDFLVRATPFKRHIPAHDQKGIRIEVKKVA